MSMFYNPGGIKDTLPNDVPQEEAANPESAPTPAPFIDPGYGE